MKNVNDNRAAHSSESIEGKERKEKALGVVQTKFDFYISLPAFIHMAVL